MWIEKKTTDTIVLGTYMSIIFIDFYIVSGGKPIGTFLFAIVRVCDI